MLDSESGYNLVDSFLLVADKEKFKDIALNGSRSVFFLQTLKNVLNNAKATL
jgi:hypothetical protein